jgi:hypothetical protein
MASGQPRLGELLLQLGLITEAQLDAALGAQPKSSLRLGEILVQQGSINEHRLVEVLARRFEMDSVDPSLMSSIHPRVVARLPRAVAEACAALPIALRKTADGDRIIVATSDPLNEGNMHRVHEALSGLKVQWVLCGARALRLAIEKHFGELEGGSSETSGFGAAASVNGHESRTRPEAPMSSTNDLKPSVEAVQVTASSVSMESMITIGPAIALEGPYFLGLPDVEQERLPDVSILEPEDPNEDRFELGLVPLPSYSRSSSSDDCWGDLVLDPPAEVVSVPNGQASGVSSDGDANSVLTQAGAADDDDLPDVTDEVIPADALSLDLVPESKSSSESPAGSGTTEPASSVRALRSRLEAFVAGGHLSPGDEQWVLRVVLRCLLDNDRIEDRHLRAGLPEPVETPAR